MEEIIKSWAGSTSHFIGEHFDRCKPYLDKDFQGMDPLVRFVSTQLYISCHLSSESSLILARNGKEWDADIINRTIIEGVVKYIYMLHGKKEETIEKAKEYWKILPDYTSIRRSEKAKSFLDACEGYDKPEWRAIQDLILTDDQILELRNGTNKKERNLLDQKWSFSNIVNQFALGEDKGLRSIAHLAHTYGMSSNLIHKDGDGIGMVWERYTREPKNQYAVTLGHMARILSDICTFAQLKTLFLHKHCGEDYGFMKDIDKNYDSLFTEFKEAGKYFNEVEYKT